MSIKVYKKCGSEIELYDGNMTKKIVDDYCGPNCPLLEKPTMADAQSKGKAQLGQNPKDLLGMKKVSISKLPPIGIVHGAHGMMNGSDKYGPYNWRDNAVIASIYYDAMMRHLTQWFDGEEVDPESGVTHLGHIIANASLLLDAQATGNLKDDRPKSGKLVEFMRSLNSKLKAKAEASSNSNLCRKCGQPKEASRPNSNLCRTCDHGGTNG